MRDPTKPDRISVKSLKPGSKPDKKNNQKIKPQVKAKYVLQQTLISPLKTTAVVNGNVVMVGDEVDGAKVLQINADSIVLLLKGVPKTFYLTSQLDMKEAKR